MIKTFKNLLYLFNKTEKKRAISLIFLMIFSSLLEVLGIGMIMPFLSVLGDLDKIQSNNFYTFASTFFKFKTNKEFIFFLAAISFTLILLSTVVRIITSIFKHKFVNLRRFSISNKLFKTFISKPYAFFLSRNSSDISKVILSEVDLVISQVVLPFFNLLMYSVLFLFLGIFLIITDPFLAVTVGVLFGGFYFLLYKIIKKRLKFSGERRLNANKQRFKAASESMAGIKEIKLRGREDFFIDSFKKPSFDFSYSNSISQIITDLPQYILELIVFGLILSVTLYYVLFKDDTIGNVLPILGLYAVSSIKIKPAVNGIYSALTKIKFGNPALKQILSDLNCDVNFENNEYNDEKLCFTKTIQLRSIFHKYEGSSVFSLNNVSIEIKKNTTIGVIGKSGAGKSTFVDVLLGLITQSSGQIKVDDLEIHPGNIKKWQNIIGYVPQFIYLFDDTILSNIAIGLKKSEIDMNKIHKVSNLAKVDDFVKNLKDGYNTEIGERGIRLSGGQRQRLGIARALYHDPELLVFDEATSALDKETENEVMDSINNLLGIKTIIIVSHNLSSLHKCDKIYEFSQGSIAKCQTDFQ